MSYTGPVYNAREQDLAPQFISQGYQGLASGIDQGFSAINAGIAKRADKRELEQNANSRFDVWLKEKPELAGEFADKFYGGSLGAKTGLLHELETMAGRQDAASADAENARRFDLKYNQDTIQAANTANYQSGMLANQSADNARQDRVAEHNMKPVAWAVDPDTGYKVSEAGAALPLKKEPIKPGMVTDPASGMGYFQDQRGQPVDPGSILLTAPGAAENTLFDGVGPPPAEGNPLLPAPAKPSIVPLRQPAGKAAAEGIRPTQEGTFFSKGGKTYKLWTPDADGFAAGQRPEWVEVPVPDPAAIPKPTPGMSNVSKPVAKPW